MARILCDKRNRLRYYVIVVINIVLLLYVNHTTLAVLGAIGIPPDESELNPIILISSSHKFSLGPKLVLV